MSKERFVSVLAAVLAGACALPAVEIDPTIGASGSGGSGGNPEGGRGGGSGAGGSAGKQGGSGGTVQEDPREEACRSYCSIYVVACAGHPKNTYADSFQCSDVCNGSDWPFGMDLTQVNSLQCRLDHAKRARDIAPDPHCAHSAEFPEGTSCAPPP